MAKDILEINFSAIFEPFYSIEIKDFCIYVHRKYIDISLLFRNERFMLDEMTRQNASKIAIFYVYENPKFFSNVYIKYGKF